MIFLGLKAKLERAHSFEVRSDRITVWSHNSRMYRSGPVDTLVTNANMREKGFGLTPLLGDRRCFMPSQLKTKQTLDSSRNSRIQRTWWPPWTWRGRCWNAAGFLDLAVPLFVFSEINTKKGGKLNDDLSLEYDFLWSKEV